MITIPRIKIENFKGIKSIETPLTHNVSIIGANGTGKSSIQDAFYWCLFGSNADGREFKVRPLDANNEIIPNLKTEVEVDLMVDHTTTTFKRVLSETKTDNTAKYFVNEVPCKLTEFNEKLIAICPIEEFKLLTSVTAFFRLNTKEARVILQKMAGDLPEEFSDANLAKGYPDVLKALSENKNLDELKREVALKGSKAKEELDKIPTRIDAQDKLKPEALDFVALKTQATSIERDIHNINNELEQSAENHTIKYAIRNEKMAQLNSKKQELLDISGSCARELQNKKRSIEDTKTDAEQILKGLQRDLERTNGIIKREERERDTTCDARDKAIAEWKEINETLFNAELSASCFSCGKPYTDGELIGMESSQVKGFNANKVSTLSAQREKIDILTQSRDAFTANVTKYNSDIDTLNTQIADCNKLITKADADIAKLPTLEFLLGVHKEYPNIKLDVEKIEKALQQTATPVDEVSANLKERRTALNQSLKDIEKEIAKEDLIKNIDTLKTELEREETVLAQQVADMKNTEDQIKEFQKRKIEVVENRVSSLFSLIKFKMYEQNLTNDGQKEICECMVDGVPYPNLNTASKVNAGLDFINAFGGAFGKVTPIFIDNKESVTQIIDTPAQVITLKVVEGAELEIINE